MAQREKKLRIWLTGAGGQLGNALIRHFGQEEGFQWIPTTRNEVELSNHEEVTRFFNFYKPNVVVNAAAYTGVDDSEVNKDEATIINVHLPELLSNLCEEHSSILFHISTDHVFGMDNTKTTPYTETDTPDPINYYGASKLEGERRILDTCKSAYIWRTAWLYSPYGKNFYTTIRRKGLEGDQFSVVTDEVGSPTSAIDLARAITKCLLRIDTDEQLPYGLYHYADRGEVSRYEFAQQILQLDEATQNVKVVPCTHSEYKTIADRPAYSTLDISKLLSYMPDISMPWQEALKEIYEIDKTNI